MQLLILSDLHGNMSALNSVLSEVKEQFSPDAVVLLGDYIDYGMRSNEIIDAIRRFEYPIICSIWGNHEHAIMSEDYSRFSTVRGIECAKRTEKILRQETCEYLNSLNGKSGHMEFELWGNKFLAVHGSLKDPLWGSISANEVQGDYSAYDYVLSGHTHYAHVFPIFYNSDNKDYRNKKRTMFINPGAVGQPRNHDPRAQYALLDTEKGIYLRGVKYDVEYEQSLFQNDVDSIYKDRLTRGI